MATVLRSGDSVGNITGEKFPIFSLIQTHQLLSERAGSQTLFQ